MENGVFSSKCLTVLSTIPPLAATEEDSSTFTASKVNKVYLLYSTSQSASQLTMNKNRTKAK